METLEQEAVKALRVLVEAKTEKEILGETERYLELRNKGWRLAKIALARADKNLVEGK